MIKRRRDCAVNPFSAKQAINVHLIFTKREEVTICLKREMNDIKTAHNNEVEKMRSYGKAYMHIPQKLKSCSS